MNNYVYANRTVRTQVKPHLVLRDMCITNLNNYKVFLADPFVGSQRVYYIMIRKSDVKMAISNFNTLLKMLPRILEEAPSVPEFAKLSLKEH